MGSVDLILLQNRATPADDAEILLSRFGLVRQLGLPERGQRGNWKYLHGVAPSLVTRLAHNMGDHELHYQPDDTIKRELASLHATKKYDLVVGRYLMPTALAGGLDLSIPALVDIDDLDTQKYISRLDRPGTNIAERWILQWHIARFQRIVPRVVSLASHLWIAADEDSNAIDHPSISVLRNIPYIDDQNMMITQPSSPDSKIILSVTSMNFQVNERAIDRFVFHVWPRIREKEPDATFVVVGSQMTDSQKDRWSAVDGVKALGFVEDLAKSYSDAAFTVVPIFEGGGTKIKVLESYIYGRTAVSASHSLRGYDHVLKDEDSIMVAENEAILVEKCVKMLRQPKLRNDMAQKGKDLVLKHFSFDSFSNRVATDVHAVFQKHGEHRRAQQ
jgi:glycosyltransferase involved in cell wall biosynthesis